MSGKDEIPELVKTRNQFACPDCGNIRWMCPQEYCSTLFYDFEDEIGEESEVTWFDAGSWQCSECGQYALPNVVTELWRRSEGYDIG